MEEKELIQKALNKAYFYLKFRSRTRQEIFQYLAKKAKRFRFTEAVINQAIASLEEQGLINDKAFIQLYIEDRSRHKPKGARLLQQELRQKGIDKELILEYLSREPVDEKALATKVLMARWDRWKGLDSLKRQEKATRFLAGRGFSFDAIKTALAAVKNVIQ